jgi:signal transduction histidine kinase
VEKLDAMATQWAARRGGVLIKVPLDLNDLLGELLTSARTKGGAASVAAEFGELPRVWGDPYLLREAFESVLDNAREAAASSVRVRTMVETRGRRRQAVLEIEDDGPGMSADFLANRLFRPFQTTKPDGVGLGLYSASQIVGLHRGKIDVQSAPGAGTIVRIVLPTVADERPAAGQGA